MLDICGHCEAPLSLASPAIPSAADHVLQVFYHFLSGPRLPASVFRKKLHLLDGQRLLGQWGVDTPKV